MLKGISERCLIPYLSFLWCDNITTGPAWQLFFLKIEKIVPRHKPAVGGSRFDNPVSFSATAKWLGFGRRCLIPRLRF